MKSRFYPWLLIVGGSLGLLASYVIMVDKLKLLENPKFVPSCSINPVLSCGTVMQSAQAHAFGFPNPFLGLAGYAAVVTIGVAILAGAKFKSWFWKGFNLGTLGGVAFIQWLIFETTFRIQAICLWCVLAWIVTIPIFVFTTAWTFGDRFPWLKRYGLVIVLIWYLLIASLVLGHFWYYFKTVI